MRRKFCRGGRLCPPDGSRTDEKRADRVVRPYNARREVVCTWDL
nr:MAG TPA_asm: hypothetical protein [Caudoviricetes sp.]